MVVEQAMDTKAKAVGQVPLLARKSDTCYFRVHKPLPNEEKNHKDHKNFEAKKLDPSAGNCGSEKGGQ